MWFLSIWPQVTIINPYTPASDNLLRSSVSAAGLTAATLVLTIIKNRLNVFQARSAFIFTYCRIAFEALVMAVWVAAFVCMILPKGKDFRLALKTPPYVPWNVAIFLAAVQMYVQIILPPIHAAIFTSGRFQQRCLHAFCRLDKNRRLFEYQYESRAVQDFISVLAKTVIASW